MGVASTKNAVLRADVCGFWEEVPVHVAEAATETMKQFLPADLTTTFLSECADRKKRPPGAGLGKAPAAAPNSPAPTPNGHGADVVETVQV